jgi:glycosyltransferase involved in cell wall biosynthesis
VSLVDQLPDVLHVIAGCRPDELGPVPPNVVLTGRLSATVTRSLLTAADVAVTPVGARYPRLELAEHLAAGVPCVSTPGGAYGLPIEDELHALVREFPEFPAAVRRLLDEPALAERLATEGRQLVELHFDAGAAASLVHLAIGALVTGGPTHAAVGGR